MLCLDWLVAQGYAPGQQLLELVVGVRQERPVRGRVGLVVAAVGLEACFCVFPVIPTLTERNCYFITAFQYLVLLCLTICFMSKCLH